MPGAKPDYIDIDKDGDTDEPMKQAASAKAQSFKDKKTDEVKARMKK